MQRIIGILMGALAVTSSGSEPIGVPADSVTVPLASITVPVASVTVSESAILCRTDEASLRDEIVAIVRGARSEAERLDALDRLWNQEDLFYLFFKPGEDRNVAVRVAAVNRFAEVDILRAIGSRTQIPEVTEAIKNRLAGLYMDDRDRSFRSDMSVFRRYVARLRSRK